MFRAGSMSCGGKVIEKEAEKMVRGGNNVAVLKVRAGVCTKCGERLYDADTHRWIDQVRRNLLEKHYDTLKKVDRVSVPLSPLGRGIG